MNIVVCLKQVPNTKEVRINPETRNIIREGVPSILNPYDENALEQALILKEKLGAGVTAVSMGPPQAEAVLQQALDMGADRAVLLSDRAVAGADTLATGYALSAMIRTLNPDLILCGSEAIDGCTGQVGPIIAENLDMPQFTYVRALDVEGDVITVSREVKDSIERLCAPLPALVCILKGINNPRKPVPSGKKPEIISAKDLDVREERLGLKGSPTRVANINSSGRTLSSFVSVDGSLPTHERIRILMNGGIIPKKIHFIRGTADELAEVILEDKTLSGQIAK